MSGLANGFFGLLACAVLSMVPSRGQVSEAIIGKLQADDDRFSPIQVLDVSAFDWDTQPRFRVRTKTIFKGPQEGALIYSIFPPTWHTKMPPPGMPPHYHHFHEWGYTLKGDSVMYEPVSPYQKNGMQYRKKQGGWLERPAYSLHGGSWETGGLRAQNPYYLLIYEEGDGSIVTLGPNGDHFKPDFPDKPDPYLPDWTQVEQFTRPWLVDSENDLEWERDHEQEGRLVKWLSDDQRQGFRARLVKVPPNWEPPDQIKGVYYEHANVMRYVLYGEMNVWTFDDPTDAGTPTTVAEDFFIYQPPRSIWGYGEGPVTKMGAYWLEVTYAKGLAVGGGPIEDPIAIPQ